MPEWKSVRLTKQQLSKIEAHGRMEWNTQSPSEARRLILAEYFASLGDLFPDADIQWGGARKRQEKRP